MGGLFILISIFVLYCFFGFEFAVILALAMICALMVNKD